MMPVPTHLDGCVVPNDAVIDESPLEGVVRCPCGSLKFDLLFPGQTREHEGETIPCTAKIKGKFFFLVKARCTTCKSEHLLLDGDFHGWNGFVCHDAKQASLPRPLLVPWKCLSCGQSEHEASVQIQTEGQEDFVSECDGKFDENLWPDGFGWFGMSIKCCGCGTETPEWISYETM